ncbi:MAG: hypothetical protein KH033_08445, partial [Clostridiales bacterium]|nr:hypothetical protein [Clostridiales bacterium]
MKKKLALLMAAIMTVAMVPMTAFASTKLTAVDEITTAVGDKHEFTSRVELSKNDDQVDVTNVYDKDGVKVFDVQLKLTNGKFVESDEKDVDYVMEEDGKFPNKKGVVAVDVKNDTTAIVSLNADIFNKNNTNGNNAGLKEACVLDIVAYAVEEGDVVATFTSNVSNFKKASEVIATAVKGDVKVETEGVVTFVEDADNKKNIKDITITGLTNGAISEGEEITLKLKGDYEFNVKGDALYDKDDKGVAKTDIITCLNDAVNNIKITKLDEDEISFKLEGIDETQRPIITIGGFALRTTKKCEAGDVAKITVSSKDFDSVTLEVAKMVEEAVTYTVEDDELPTIWAGKAYDETNTLEVAIEENTGDILNTSRKATFTFPEGIEVVKVDVDGADNSDFTWSIDENVVEMRNYSTEKESDKTDMTIKFILNAAPTFSGDVKVTLGGEFDDVELKVATVKAPYTVEAKTSEVLIDYRYVPVNEIVITEAEDGLLEEGDKIYLEVEKMDFEDAGSYEVTGGDIEVDVTIDDNKDNTAQLVVEVTDDSTEASTVTISGLELYLDRTLPVGGYALKNVGAWNNKDGVNKAANILWENSSDDEDIYDKESGDKEAGNGIFKYKAVTCNDKYVEVVTSGRDNDDSTTNRKIVITIGATTMAVGT